MQQNIIITGAGGGFGKLTALALLQAGHKVVGTMRDIEGRNRTVADELRKAGAELVEMDVTSDASVEAGIAAAIEKLGGQLDVVINNAGYGVLGLQESFTPSDWKKLFDINLFGMVRVNRAVLPTLRGQCRGLLIHVSSLLGRITLPFYGPYTRPNGRWRRWPKAIASNCQDLASKACWSSRAVTRPASCIT